MPNSPCVYEVEYGMRDIRVIMKNASPNCRLLAPWTSFSEASSRVMLVTSSAAATSWLAEGRHQYNKTQA